MTVHAREWKAAEGEVHCSTSGGLGPSLYNKRGSPSACNVCVWTLSRYESATGGGGGVCVCLCVSVCICVCCVCVCDLESVYKLVCCKGVHVPNGRRLSADYMLVGRLNARGGVGRKVKSRLISTM